MCGIDKGDCGVGEVRGVWERERGGGGMCVGKCAVCVQVDPL